MPAGSRRYEKEKADPSVATLCRAKSAVPFFYEPRETSFLGRHGLLAPDDPNGAGQSRLIG